MYQIYDPEEKGEGFGSTLVELLALAIGGGVALLILHWLGVLALIQQWVALG